MQELEFESDVQILESTCVHPANTLLSDLQLSFDGEPAQIVDPDLGKWAKWAKEEGLKYADYGESLYIPTVGRIIRPWEGAPWSASQLVRQYLKLQDWDFPLHRSSGWGWEESSFRGTYQIYDWVRNGADDWGDVPLPAVVFKGPVSGDWAYVDLCHAYWQIGSRLPFWVEKPGDRLVRRGAWARADELVPYRKLRLNLFGMMTYPGGGVTWRYPDGSLKVGQCPAWQASVSNIAWGTAILTVIHALASETMEKFPNVALWHTDGAIVPIDDAERVIEWISTRWGIEAKIKEVGSGIVAGAGNYEWRKSFRRESINGEHSNLINLDLDLINSWFKKHL